MIKDFVETQEGVLRMVRDALLDTQRAVAVYMNRNSTDVHFRVGEKVYLSTRNFSSVHFERREKKFQQPFVGPFQVLEVCSEYTYRLDLPTSLKRLFPIFHASLLFRRQDEAMVLLESEKDEFQERLFLDDGSLARSCETVKTTLPNTDTPPLVREVQHAVSKESTKKISSSTDAEAKKESSVAKTKPAAQVVKEDKEWLFEKVLKREWIDTARPPQYKYLIKWLDFDATKNSYVYRRHLQDEKNGDYFEGLVRMARRKGLTRS